MREKAGTGSGVVSEEEWVEAAAAGMAGVAAAGLDWGAVAEAAAAREAAAVTVMAAMVGGLAEAVVTVAVVGWAADRSNTSIHRMNKTYPLHRNLWPPHSVRSYIRCMLGTG